MYIREDFRIRRVVRGKTSIDDRIVATFRRAERIAARESGQHDGVYVVDAMTNLTSQWRPVVVYRGGELVDES